mmetsp:Transcript_49986/g.57538  ORF Transcript_49986/g.57538 Transcript_49986/m.57538 type:complete len:200 (-) Transcript_49986:163-762(-)
MLKAEEIKVVLLGASGVGKSSIVLRFVTGDFKVDHESTLGAAFMAKMLVHNGKSAKFQIWDTAGQEKYQSLAPMYYRDSKVAIVVYDVTKKETFLEVRNWISELKEKGPSDIMIWIVGNKTDLLNADDQSDCVGVSEANEYAKSIGAHSRMTSAKEDKGIKDLFIKVFEEFQNTETEARGRNFTLDKGAKKTTKEGGCC